VKTFSPSFFTRRQTAGAGSAPGDSSLGAAQPDDFRRLVLAHLGGA
jgi:RNA polymerase sigma factor (sigma-70 family)